MYQIIRYMKVNTPSKTAICEVLEDHQLKPLTLDADVMREVAFRNGGLSVSAIQSYNVLSSSFDCKLNSSNDTGVTQEMVDVAIDLNTSRLGDKAWVMYPEVLENVKEGYSVRTLKVGELYDKYHYSRKGNCLILSVRSDHESYTALDAATPFCLYYTDQGKAFFAMHRESLNLWVADLVFILRNVPHSVRLDIEDEYEMGLFATEDLVMKYETALTEKQMEDLYRLRSNYNEQLLRTQANQVCYEFFYKDIRKIKLGTWKVSRGETNFSGGETVELSFNNNHSIIELSVDSNRVGSVKSVAVDDERTLLNRFLSFSFSKTRDDVDSYNQRWKETNLKINGVAIPIEIKNSRHYIFGFAVKNDEALELIQSLCCTRDPEEMKSIAKEVSVLSLYYRKLLSEGLNTKILFNGVIGERFNDALSTYRDSMYSEERLGTYGRRKAVFENHALFKFERRGARGLYLVLSKTKKVPIYPYDLTKLFKIPAGYHSALEVQRKQVEWFLKKINAMGGEQVSNRDIVRWLWSSRTSARVAVNRSKILLQEVSKELGSEKIQIRVEGRPTPAYAIVGSSGIRYAITDDGRFRNYREVPENDESNRWVFICIEGTSDQSHEVDKDRLVTRMLALKDDVSNVDDINTLGFVKQHMANKANLQLTSSN